MNKISHNMNYSIEELSNILQTYEFNKMDNSYNDLLVYKIYDNENLPGEIFRLYADGNYSTYDFRGKFWNTNEAKKYKIEVSNLGRIKVNGVIKKQYQRKYGYLFVNITPDISYEVYRLVAETWLDCPVENTQNSTGIIWTIHHITDNGFDNRPSNLLWMTDEDHQQLGGKTRLINDNINKKILQKFENILQSKKDEIDKDTIIDYLEDICALQTTRQNIEAMKKIENIIDFYDINKTEYPYINWERNERFLYKD